MPYKYKPYPAWRYRYGKDPVLVTTKDEDDALQADGWECAPVKAVKELLVKHGASEEVAEADAEKLAVGIAGATNALAKVPDLKRKKAVLSIAHDLGINLDPELSLKTMKAELLEKAGKFQELPT